jgi:hypothetical protein
MAQILPIVLVAAVIFGICYLVDKTFSKLFRSKAQHRSGMAVRVNKRYGVFGIGLCVLGVLSVGVGVSGGLALTLGGIVVLIMGICLSFYYLTHGIFYDGETFLVSSFRKDDLIYRFEQITEQKLYLVQGGNIIIELYMNDGTSVSLQSSMDGVYLFLDTAFAGWCLQKGIDPQTCDFHDPSKSWWFPHEEES